ncbi:hypothetical protein ACTHGU_19775 [Chitinophagaceae bacterium MMS25-I14]
MSYPFNDYRKRPRGKWLFFPFIAALMVLVLGCIVMLLWNAILPRLLHVPEISYWQAVGLLVLCRILFGNFGRGGGHRMQNRDHMRNRGGMMREKWKEMTPEERARFKSEWREHCRRRNDNRQ